MKKYRAILCTLLALLMILSFSACDRPAGDESGQESSLPVETGGEESIAPSEETPDEASAAVSIPPNPYEDRSDLVILNWEEYLNRPHEIQSGTVLNYAVPNDVPSQLPWNCVSEGWLTGNIYEGLLYMYMNDPTDIRGCIAESWTHSDNYLTWNFQIRDDVTFHDGTVCDASAIAKSWDFYKEASPASFTNLYIESWEAISDKALVITLSAPCAWFETSLSRLYIVSPTELDLYGIQDNTAAVGTGPYYIDSYTSDVSIVLKANPNYYLEEKMPCIETVNFEIIRGQEDIIGALLDGKIDGANLSNLESYYNMVANGYDGNLFVTYLNENNFTGACPLWFNANIVEVFRTFEVRKAICRFINFNAINELVYDYLGLVQDSIWEKGSSGYVPTDQFYYNPDEGQELLASVGMEASDIKFNVLVSVKPSDVLAAVQSELNKAGVIMSFELLHPESSYTILNGGSWTIISGTTGYRNTTPYIPWEYILKPDTLFKMCFQDIYNPDLYQKMLGEYGAITEAATWDDMLIHCKQLTTYVQNDFGAIGGVQAPEFLALSKEFKNGIYFSEQHFLQAYYLFQ